MTNSKRKPRGAARPAPKSLENVRAMLLEHTTVPLWPHAGQAYGLSRDTTYAAANAGQIPGAIKVGAKWIVVSAVLSKALGIDLQTEIA